MKKFSLVFFVLFICLTNHYGQETVEYSKMLLEYEVMEDGDYGYHSTYTYLSSSSTFLGALSNAVMNFNTGSVPPNNFSTLDAEIKKLEMLQNSLQSGTYSKADLENFLNQQKLTLTMLQNILKLNYDTTISIIRKLAR